MTHEAKHILVAEDNAAMGSVVRYNLEKAGFDVTVAACGQTAWNLLNERGFDLVVSDFQMPGMTGEELCRRMRKDARLAEIPVILLTAKGLELDKDRMQRELGTSSVMSKPFSPRELTQTVRDCLAVGATVA